MNEWMGEVTVKNQWDRRKGRNQNQILNKMKSDIEETKELLRQLIETQENNLKYFDEEKTKNDIIQEDLIYKSSTQSKELDKLRNELSLIEEAIRILMLNHIMDQCEITINSISK